MGIISWIVLGAIAGWIGSLIVNKTGEGLFRDIVLGIVGGIVGGWIFSAAGSTGVTGFNLWSLGVAVIGAIVVLLIYHAIARPSRI
jgi:uncharacterized membrane protein YeaQ/YmgE (transglycosylase-associated protein family)